MVAWIGHSAHMLDRRGQPLGQNAENDSVNALARKVSFLSRSDSYVPPEAVITRETHMSWVFMVGDRRQSPILPP